MMRKYILLGCLLAIASASAQAQVVEQTVLQPRDQTYFERDFGKEAAIAIRAVNSLQCSVIFDQASANVNLVSSRVEEVGVSLNCNMPFRLKATAANGALRHTELYQSGNARSYLPYSVSWPSMVSNGGEPVAANFSAAGAQWAGGLDFVSGTSVIDQHGGMRINWGSARELLAGNYRETFTIEMEPVD